MARPRTPSLQSPLPPRPGLLPLAACVLAAVVLGACDDSFSPIAPSEVPFSVFGYLDAAVDTQFVRVMPIRSQILTSPDSFGIAVTLEHLGTGRTVELRDSVFRFTHYTDPELGSEGAYFHNYWTTEEIEPGASYRFTVTQAGEDPAEATVEIPDEYDVEVWLGRNWYDDDYVRIAGLKHVAFLSTRTSFSDRCGSTVDTVWYKDRTAEGEEHMIAVSEPEVTPREGCGLPRVDGRAFHIVGSESPWPSSGTYSPGSLGSAERASNITNAVGFIGGVLTRVVPYEECHFLYSGPDVPEYCQLRYGPMSATLDGRVMETRCGDGAMDSVTVELREVDRVPSAATRVRTILTNRSGRFRVGALDPAVRYALKVRAKPEWDPFWGEVDIHTLYYDTLQFTPGEQAEMEIGLERLTSCGSGQ